MEFYTEKEKHKMDFSGFINNNRICIILRSLPGGGKTYKSRELLVKFGGDEDHVFSADKYFDHIAEEEFIKQRGRKPDAEELKAGYKKVWNAGRLGAAHRWCLDQFQAAVDLGITPVILDNTNTQKRQFKSYCEYAEKEGYKIRIEEPTSPWWLEARSDLGKTKLKYSKKLQKLLEELLKHGQHGVPKETLERLIDSTWQNVPGGVGRYVTCNELFKDRRKSKFTRFHRFLPILDYWLLTVFLDFLVNLFSA